VPLQVAVISLFESQDPSWGPTYWRGESDPHLARGYNDPSERMTWIVSLLTEVPELEDKLGEWTANTLSNIANSWREDHVINAGQPLALVEALENCGRLEDGIAQAAKTFASVERGSLHAYRWRQAPRLRRVIPELFTDEEWEVLQARFRGWAEEELTTGEDLQDDSDLDEITDVASELGIELDEEKVLDARMNVVERADVAKREAERERERRRVANDAPRAQPPAVDETAVRALFGRLAEQP
jgi:hypothetical protein